MGDATPGVPVIIPFQSNALPVVFTIVVRSLHPLIAFAFIVVILLLVFGYGTLFGFDKLALLASVKDKNVEYESSVLITEIKPLISNIKLREGTKRKLYLSK